MKSVLKRNIVIISLLMGVVIIGFYMKSTLHIEKNIVTQDQENIIKDTLQNGPESIVKYDCGAFSGKQTQEFCEKRTKRIKDFYSKMKWEDVKKQLSRNKLLDFNCNVLNQDQMQICKKDLFVSIQ